MNVISRSMCRIVPTLLESSFFTQRRVPVVLSNRLFTQCTFMQPLITQKVDKLGLPSTNNVRFFQTRGSKELADFLKQEIVEEKQSMARNLPSTLGDFTVTFNNAEVKLQKDFHGEQITILMDVNHTVQDESPAELIQEGQVDLRSKPAFEVGIKIGDTTLSLTCEFAPPEAEEVNSEQQADMFGISEVTVYTGDWSEETYRVSGDILDETLYELLINYLEERGISNKFAAELVDLCTDYEHAQYVNLLQGILGFVSK